MAQDRQIGMRLFPDLARIDAPDRRFLDPATFAPARDAAPVGDAFAKPDNRADFGAGDDIGLHRRFGVQLDHILLHDGGAHA